MNRRSSRLRRCLLTVGLPCLIFLPQCTHAATPAQYDRALARIQSALSGQEQALRHGVTLPAAESPAAIAASVLAPITSVERPDAPPQAVDNQLLLASLTAAGGSGDTRHRIAGLQALSVQIDVLRRDLSGDSGGAKEPRGMAAEETAKAVLAAEVYSSDPLPPPSLMDRFWDWLTRTLNRLFKTKSPPSKSPSFSLPNISLPFVKGLVIVLAAGAFAVLVAVLVQWLRRCPARTPSLALDEAEAALVEARDTDSLRALAEVQARAGDYRRAFRLIYIATLVALDTGGVLRFDRSKTNWEYLRALRAAGRGDVYDAMTPLTREFDRLWYGFAPAEAADYARALTQYDAFQAAQFASVARPPAVA